MSRKSDNSPNDCEFAKQKAKKANRLCTCGG